MNLFEQAIRRKLRFQTSRGEISTEALFDLPLTSANGFDLDNLAKSVKRELDKSAEESFVSTARASTATIENTLRLDLIKAVIAEKLELKRRQEQAATLAERRQQLLGALDDRNRAELASMSKEDILAELGRTELKDDNAAIEA